MQGDEGLGLAGELVLFRAAVQVQLAEAVPLEQAVAAGHVASSEGRLMVMASRAASNR